MKTVTYSCDICGIEIDNDKLITVKIEKNTKHFCADCVSTKDFENIITDGKVEKQG